MGDTLGKLFRISCYYQVHGTEILIHQENPFIKRLMFYTIKNAKKIFAMGNYQRKNLERLKIDPNNICVVLDGTDPEKWDTDGDGFFDNINDPYQMVNIVDDKKYHEIINKYRKYLSKKMDSLKDTFPESTWYLENWIYDRKIERSATLKSGV